MIKLIHLCRPYGDIDVILAVHDQTKCSEIALKVCEELGGKEAPIKHDKTYSFLTKERFQVKIYP